MPATACQVLIVGAGPVGLTLACELARRGLRPRLIERLKSPLPYCRALGVTSRTLEVWDDLGIVREMIDAGIWITGQRNITDGHTQDLVLDLSDLPYSTLGLPQYETERILARHAESLGVAIERGITLESLTQSDGQVHTVLLADDGQREEAAFDYVIGCDGAHSTVRKALGIAFDGDAFPYSFMLGDVQIDWDLPRGMSLRALRPIPDAAPDMFVAVPLPEAGRYRVSMLAPPELDSSPGSGHGIQAELAAPGIAVLQAVADRLLPERAVLSNLRWSSIYRISMRLAAHYRQGRVFLAGDAAHIHPPTGGQGMNTGIQDAYNLAWKLALVAQGASPAALLDSYEAERRPVGEEVVRRTTEASVKLGRESGEAARLADTQVLVNYRTSSGTEAASDTTTGPRAGDRVPDCQGLQRQGLGYPLRLFDVLRGPEHVLIAQLPQGEKWAANVPQDLTALLNAGHFRGALVVGTAQDSAQFYRWPCYVDALGEFAKRFGPAPNYLLVRPDGYLAWRGSSLDDPRLREILQLTFLGQA